MIFLYIPENTLGGKKKNAGKNEPQKEHNMAESFNILVYI